MTLEYRLIGRLPTCVGNARIRVASDGEVSQSRNRVECDPGALWSDPWRIVGRLDAPALAQLTRHIADTGLLTAAPESIDEATHGGKREELDLTIGDREYHFVAQNTNPPAFRAVVTLLWDVIARLAS